MASLVKAYGIVPYYVKGDDIKILLCKSVASKDRWGCLKGTKTRNETAYECAKREFFEESSISVDVALFEEYFEQQECELNFTPIQIIAVYQDGIKLLNSEYEIILPKKIKIKEYVDENIQIEYTHLKS